MYQSGALRMNVNFQEVVKLVRLNKKRFGFISGDVDEITE